MVNNVQSQGPEVKPYHKSLRLSFRVVDGKVRLESYERLEMVCPPSIGARPEAGKNSGFWMEVRDASDRVFFHHILYSPLADYVEVYSPDGKIRREFRPVKESVFEVILPDDDDARSIVLMGEYLKPEEAGEQRGMGAHELARFDVPNGEKGGRQ